MRHYMVKRMWTPGHYKYMCLLSISMLFFALQIWEFVKTTSICIWNKTCSYKLYFQNMQHQTDKTPQYISTTSCYCTWIISEYPQGKAYVLRRFSNILWLCSVSLYHQNNRVKMRISETALYLRLNAGWGSDEVLKSA